jgi:hypothetical protein
LILSASRKRKDSPVFGFLLIICGPVIISPNVDQKDKLRMPTRCATRSGHAVSVNWGQVQSIQKEKEMNKFFKPLSLILGLALAAIVFGTQIVRALPNAAAPLPYGLTAKDTMATVEQKLGQPREIYVPQAGWEPGLPDEGGSPDHVHYWAIYRRFGVTIVYNSPSPNNKNATIHAIRLHK